MKKSFSPGMGSDFGNDPTINAPDPIEEAIRDLQEKTDQLAEDDGVLNEKITDLNTAISQIRSGDFTFASWHGASGNGIADDTAAIQAALDSGKSNVFLDPGTYRITHTLKIGGGTRLIGNRAILEYHNATPAVYASAICLTNKTDGVTGGWSAAADIEIRGLTFTAPDDERCTLIMIKHARNVEIHNCLLSGLRGWHMIELNSTADSEIRGCIFRSYPYGGSLTNASEMLQLDCASDNIPAPTCEPFDSTECSNITISENVFYNQEILPFSSNYDEQFFPVGIGSHNPVDGHVHTAITIRGNTFRNLTGAMRFQSLQDSEICDNKILGCSYGIALTGSYAGLRCSIINNLIYLFHLDAGTLSPMITTGNWQALRGISVEVPPGQPERAQYLNVSGNTIRGGHSYPIAITADHATVNDNRIITIDNSAISGLSIDTTSGIYLYYCTRSVCAGNTVTYSGNTFGHFAIRLNTCSHTLISGNMIAAPSGKAIGSNSRQEGSGNLVGADNLIEVV